MNSTEWLVDKINSSDIKNVIASVESSQVIFVQRKKKPDAYIGVVSVDQKSSAPIVWLNDATALRAQKTDMAMMIAIPRVARWSGEAMRWLQKENISFGGVGNLLSAIRYNDEMSDYRIRIIEFVQNGLLQHSFVDSLGWIDSKKVRVRLRNNVTVTIALEDAYDITMAVARDAAGWLAPFDVLLKTNPNGSITSQGAESLERLGFQILKWGELFGYLAQRGR